jgi:glycosyltransferase involved in cell wall biosynthesis
MARPAVTRRGSGQVALWPIPVSDLGGVARHVLDVGSTGLPGWDLVVLCPPGPFADTATARGLDVRADAFGRPAGALPSLRTLRRTIRDLRPQVVHSHLAFADLIAAAVGPGRGGTLVTTEHGISTADAALHESSTMSGVMARIHRLRQHRTDGLIAVSDATLAAVEAKWRPPAALATTVIRNGIDRPETRSPRASGLHVGAVGRLAPEKNLDMLIRAFALVVARRPDARLTIAGDGPRRGALVDAVAAAGLVDVVDFPGHVDSSKVFGDLDVVVMPSVFENCSYTLLEAAATGCGVVATDVGGNGEILPAGSLVALGDDEALAAAIIGQGLDPSTRPGLADDWPTVADMCASIVAFYERLIAAGHRT